MGRTKVGSPNLVTWYLQDIGHNRNVLPFRQTWYKCDTLMHRSEFDLNISDRRICVGDSCLGRQCNDLQRRMRCAKFIEPQISASKRRDFSA